MGGCRSEGWRTPAQEIERVVITAIRDLLNDEKRLVDVVHGDGATPTQIRASIDAATDLANLLNPDNPIDAFDKANELVERVDIQPDQIRINLSKKYLNNLVGGDASESSPIELQCSIALRRRGVESRIVLAGDKNIPTHDEGLIDLVAKTHGWFNRITAGEVTTVRDIADEANLDEGVVSRFLPLAFLAPDIVETILNGNQSFDLTAEKLKRLRSLPKSWDE